MKQKLLTTTKTLIAILAVVAMTGIASAWTAPTGTAPSGNVPAPVNTGAVTQTKNGSLNINGYLGVAGAYPSGAGFFQSLLTSPKGLFGCASGSILSCAATAASSTNLFSAGAFTSTGTMTKGLLIDVLGGVYAKNTPVGVDLSGVTGSQGRNAFLGLVSSDNTNPLSAGAVFQTNADKFSFFNLLGTDRVGISAKKIQLTDGAAAGKVLTSMDANGNAVWGDGASGDPVQTGSLIKYVRAEAASGSARSVFCGANPANGNMWDAAAISDDANWIVVGGGGHCQYGTQISQPVINRNNTAHGSGTSTTHAIGWHIDCLDQVSGSSLITDGGTGNNSGFARVEAICMKKNIDLATAAGTSTPSTPSTPPSGGGGGGGGGGGNPPPALPTWNNATFTIPATNGQTCAAWIAANGASYGPTTTRSNNPSFNVSGSTFQQIQQINGNCAYLFESPITKPGANPSTSTCQSYPMGTNPGVTGNAARPVKTCSDSNAMTGSISLVGWDIQTQFLY